MRLGGIAVAMQTEIRSLLGSHVMGADGEEIGEVGQVYLNDGTGEPEWVTVRTGLFGMKQTFVPLMNARRSGEEIRVPFDMETIKQAPNIDVDGRLSLEEEVRIYRHYGIRPTGVPFQRTAEPGSGLGGDRTRAGSPHVHLYKYVETETVSRGTEQSPVDYLRSLRGKRRPGQDSGEQGEVEKERMPLDTCDEIGDDDDLNGFGDERPPGR